jgi:Domain of unknown function (DUF4407)
MTEPTKWLPDPLGDDDPLIDGDAVTVRLPDSSEMAGEHKDAGDWSASEAQSAEADASEPKPLLVAELAREPEPDAAPTLMDELATDETPPPGVHESIDPPAESAATTPPDQTPNGQPIAEPPPPNPYPFNTPEPLPERRNLGRFLRRFAGVDEELMAWVPQERVRYTGMGGAVLFTGVMALLSMTIALSLAFSTKSPLILIPALVWFVLILNFDRWLVSSPMTGSFWSKLASFTVRMGMAVLFGIIIAEPLVLAVFNTAVHTQVLNQRADDLKKYEAQWERCNPLDLTTPTVTPGAGATPAPSSSATTPSLANTPQCANFVVPLPENVKALRSDFADKQAQLTSVQSTLKPLNDQYNKLVQKSQDECLGRPGQGLTGRFGAGPVCQRLTRDAQNYAKLNRIDDLEKNVVTLTNDLQSLSTQIRNASTQWASQRSAYIAKQVAQRAAANQKIGLLERIEALNTLARTHAALGGAIWAVRLLFILIDLAPALLKYTSGQTRYDRLVDANLRLGEARFKAAMRAETARAQRWAEDAENDLDVERARAASERTVQYDKIMDDLEHYWANSAEAATLRRPVRPSAMSNRGWREATSRYSYDIDGSDPDDRGVSASGTR